MPANNQNAPNSSSTDSRSSNSLVVMNAKSQLLAVAMPPPRLLALTGRTSAVMSHGRGPQPSEKNATNTSRLTRDNQPRPDTYTQTYTVTHRQTHTQTHHTDIETRIHTHSHRDTETSRLTRDNQPFSTDTHSHRDTETSRLTRDHQPFSTDTHSHRQRHTSTQHTQTKNNGTISYLFTFCTFLHIT